MYVPASTRGRGFRAHPPKSISASAVARIAAAVRGHCARSSPTRLAPRRRNASEAVSARATCSRIPANLKPGHSKLATCHRLASLAPFAAERGLVVAGIYVENASGASLSRPELFRLIRDSKSADVLLLEQVDRLTRLTEGDWQRLSGGTEEPRNSSCQYRSSNLLDDGGPRRRRVHQTHVRCRQRDAP